MENSADEGAIAPIVVSVKQAAQALSISTWSMYQLLDRDQMVSRYIGRRRVVEVASLHEYAKNLPTKRPTVVEVVDDEASA